MPNVKIYLDRSYHAPAHAQIEVALPDLVALISAELRVQPAAVQLALVDIDAPGSQRPINVELQIMPAPIRTRAFLEGVGRALKTRIDALTGLGVAIRIAQLDPDTYVAL